MSDWLNDIAQKVLAKQKPGDYVITANGESLNKVLPQIGQTLAAQNTATAPPNPPPVNTNYTIAPSTDPNLVSPPIDRAVANGTPAPSPYIQQMADGAVNPNVTTPDDPAPNKLSYGQLTPDGRIQSDTRKIADLQATPLPQQNSFIRRLATGVLSGLAHGDTQNGIGGLLGSALGGGAVDAFSPKAEAQQRTNNELQRIGQRLSTNMAMRNQQIAQQQAQAKLKDTQSKIDKRTNDAKTAQDKLKLEQGNALEAQNNESYKRLNEQQQHVIDLYKNLPEFDPTNPDTKSLVDMAEAAKITLPKKRREDAFALQIAPNGTPIIVNTHTGDYKTGAGNYSKPPTLTANELPDELFGLYSDKDVTDKAMASVGKLPTDRRIKPEIAQTLLNTTSTDENNNTIHPYQNPDGSLNESKVVDDITGGAAPIRNLTDLYDNLPSDYEQKLAGQRDSIRGGQKALRDEVARFRLAAANLPKAAALDKIDQFKAIMKMSPQNRKTKLDQFYKGLTPSQSAGGTYSGKTFNLALARPSFPGKTDDEIRQIITAQGGKVQ